MLRVKKPVEQALKVIKWKGSQRELVHYMEEMIDQICEESLSMQDRSVEELFGNISEMSLIISQVKDPFKNGEAKNVLKKINEAVDYQIEKII